MPSVLAHSIDYTAYDIQPQYGQSGNFRLIDPVEDLSSLKGELCFAFTTSAAADNNLADRHAQKGFNCAHCHVEKVPCDAPEMASCLNCHGGSYEELGKASAEIKPNPHYTHMGDKECAVCHKGHMAPEFFCNNCHKFKLQVP